MFSRDSLQEFSLPFSAKAWVRLAAAADQYSPCVIPIPAMLNAMPGEPFGLTAPLSESKQLQHHSNCAAPLAGEIRNEVGRGDDEIGA